MNKATSIQLLPMLFIVLLCLLGISRRSESFTIPPITKQQNYSQQKFLVTPLYARSKKKKKPPSNIISLNRQARRNYEVVSTYIAGVSLLGSEIKAIRDGKMNLRDGFVRPDKKGRGLSLLNVHIGKHTTAEYFNHEERRIRPLLLRKEECRKLRRESDFTGMTIVPLKAFFNDNNLVKIEIGLCRGKNTRDKRADIKEREAKRDTQRMVKTFRIG